MRLRATSFDTSHASLTDQSTLDLRYGPPSMPRFPTGCGSAGGLHGSAASRSHKHFQLDAANPPRAQRMLRTSTETEANDRFVTSGIDIQNAYGALEK